MSVEYDRSKFLRSSGAPCRVLLGRAYAAEHPRTVLGNLLRISTLYKPIVGLNDRILSMALRWSAGIRFVACY